MSGEMPLNLTFTKYYSCMKNIVRLVSSVQTRRDTRLLFSQMKFTKAIQMNRYLIGLLMI